MRGYHGMHRAQVAVLDGLRRRQRARFSELGRGLDMTSDNFKFHIRKLQTLGYIAKADDGYYELTASGKEFANRLDTQRGKAAQRPKASMLLIVTSQCAGKEYFLLHQRRREPYFGFWGIGSGPVPYGVSIAQAAHDELLKQTGLAATFEHRGVLRVIDTDPAGEVREDRLFSLMHAQVDGCPPPSEWPGGVSVWMTEQEALRQTPLFQATRQTIDMYHQHTAFAETTCEYSDEQY